MFIVCIEVQTQNGHSKKEIIVKHQKAEKNHIKWIDYTEGTEIANLI